MVFSVERLHSNGMFGPFTSLKKQVETLSRLICYRLELLVDSPRTHFEPEWL